MEFNTDIFAQFDKKWALLSAGPKDDHNTMTISWGSMGTLWNKPAVTVYVRPTRFTHKFMNEYEYFTVSFFPEDKRDALVKMGSTTGRSSVSVIITEIRRSSIWRKKARWGVCAGRRARF